eukprot:scaffold2982_cov154-Isochrysis_galbana.AAC.7
MVPLYPNELTPPEHECAAGRDVSAAAICVGIMYVPPQCSDASRMCWLSTRNCVFGGERSCNIPATSCTMPATPAAGSA